MDMSFAFVCGLGLFHLLSPLLPIYSPPPPPAENTTAQKVVKREHSKVRRKTRTMRAYRGSRKKRKEDKVLVSLLRSMLGRLVDAISFCHLLRQEASGEVSTPEAVKAHLPPRQPTEESVATNLSLVASSAPLKEHLLPKDSKILTPVLLNSSASTEPKSSMSDSQPPETLTPERHHSPPPPPPPQTTSLPSHPSDPMACPPSPSTMSPQCEGKALWNSESTPLPGLPTPTPTTVGLDQSSTTNSTIPGYDDSSRPTSTTHSLDHSNRPIITNPGLDNSHRPTSTNAGLEQPNRSISTTLGLEYSGRHTSTKPGLDKSSRPISTTLDLDKSSRPILRTPGIDHLNRSTSITPALEETSRPIPGPSWYQVAAKTWCNSNLSHGESLKDYLSPSLQEASFWTDSTSRKIEAGEPWFINPDIQAMLELQITKRVQLKVWKGKGEERAAHVLGHQDSMLQATATSHNFWGRNYNSEQYSGHQELFCQKVSGDHLEMKYSQLFWGFPFLHSESLVAAFNMAGSMPDLPSIVFNVFSTYLPSQAQTNGPPQLFSPKPVLHHPVISQTLTQKMSSVRAPPVAAIQTQARDPSSLPKLPRPSPLIRDYGASSAMTSRLQFIVPSAVQHLELHILKKQQESSSELPVMVKKSQETCNRLTSNSWVSKGHGSVVQLPGEFINTRFREQLEQQLITRFIQQQGQLPHNVQLSLDLMKSQDKLSVTSQEEGNDSAPYPSSLADDNSQNPQSVQSEGPEIFQTWRDPGMDLIDCLQRTERDLDRSPEGPLGKVLEEISETEEETYHMRLPRRDAQGVSLVGRGKEQIEETRKTCSSRGWRHTKDSKVPVAICQGIRIDQTLVPPDNSNTNMKTWETSPLIDETICKKTKGPSFPDANTQKVLETHLKKHLVRHRWSLPLRGLKTIQVLNVNKATALPSNVSLSSWDSREACADKMANVLGDAFQKAPEEKMMKITTTVESRSTQEPPSALQLKLLRDNPSSGNPGPSEAPTTFQKDHMTSMSTPQSFVGRVWHRGKVHGHCTGNPVPIPGLVKAVYESQESGCVSFREIYKEVLVREISVTSQSPSGMDTWHLEEAEEEQSSSWARTTEVGELTKSPTYSESQETSESPSRFRPISQDPEDSGLSTPHSLAPGVVLKDCATEIFLQDCAPEVLLAADILASRASKFSFKTLSPSIQSKSHGRHPFISRERNLPKISQTQEPRTSHIVCPNYKKVYVSPRQEVKRSESRPVQAYRSNIPEKKFGDKIKNYIVSILTPKDKGQEKLLQKVKGLSGTTQSRGSGMSRFFMPQEDTKTQGLKTSVAPILEEKLGIHHRCAPSKKSTHQDRPQAQVSRHVHHHRIPTAQSKMPQGNTGFVHQAKLKVHSQHSTKKWMPYANNWAQVSREAVSRASYYQHRAQTPLVPGTPVHCPRHCPCRGVLSGKPSAFPYWK